MTRLSQFVEALFPRSSAESSDLLVVEAYRDLTAVSEDEDFDVRAPVAPNRKLMRSYRSNSADYFDEFDFDEEEPEDLE